MTVFNETLLTEWAEYIRTSPGTSFVELERVARKHITVEGDQGLYLLHAGLEPDEESNVLMWENVSETFIDHTNELTRRGFYARPTQAMVYFLDGRVPNRPEWNPRGSKPKNPKRIHWLPMAFFVLPPGGLPGKASCRP